MASNAQVLLRIHGELEQLERRRHDLDRTISRLRRIASWLQRRAATRQARTAHEVGPPQSLTDSCRAVLRMSTAYGLTPREVKRLLTESGFAWTSFTNPMSAVHTVLKRLVQQREAVSMIGKEGERRFALKPTRVVALTRKDVENEDFVKKLLDANSPEDVVALIKERRPRSGGS